MPPEAVLESEFSCKSDVWSFGVFCWEVFTLADMPYKMATDEDVLRGLKSGDMRLDPLGGAGVGSMGSLGGPTPPPPMHQMGGSLSPLLGGGVGGGYVHEPMQRLIYQCTEEGPQHRPSFSEIVMAIGEMTVDSGV